MDERPIAGIVTVIIIAPLIALCCLGPLFIGSAVGGVVGWLSGQGPVLTVALALLAGALGFAVMRWRRASSRAQAGTPCVREGSATWRSGKLDHVDGRRVDDRSSADHSSREVARFNRETSRGPKDERLRP